MGLAGWLLFLCLATGSLAVAQKEKEGMALLEKVAQRYDQAKAFYFEGTIVTHSKSPNSETKITQTFSLAFQRPKSFRLVLKDPAGQTQQVIVSDGTHLFIEVPTLKQVMKRSAPAAGLPLPGGNILSGALKEHLTKVKEAKLVGEEKVGNRVAKKVQVTTADGMKLLLWLADNTLWQTSATIEGKALIPQGKSSGQQPNPFVEAMKQTTITQTLTFTKVTFNPTLSPKTFSYKPPAGFKVVEEKEVMKALPAKPGP